jgi:hypothetical protein
MENKNRYVGAAGLFLVEGVQSAKANICEFYLAFAAIWRAECPKMFEQVLVSILLIAGCLLCYQACMREAAAAKRPGLPK